MEWGAKKILNAKEDDYRKRVLIFIFFGRGGEGGDPSCDVHYDTNHEYSTIQRITIVQFDASDRENSGTIIIDVIYL